MPPATGVLTAPGASDEKGTMADVASLRGLQVADVASAVAAVTAGPLLPPGTVTPVGGVQPFHCPLCHCLLDGRRHLPVRVPCTACRRLVCRKCASVLSTMPDPVPCSLCGAPGQEGGTLPSSEALLELDRGVLLAVIGQQPETLSTPCVECTAVGRSVMATWTCGSEECVGAALCDGHGTLHRTWDHVLHVLSGDDSAPPEAVLAVSHCPKPQHAGVEGRLTHFCRRCKVLVCARCGVAEHLDEGHTVVPLASAGADAEAVIASALPQLAACADRLQGTVAQVQAALVTVDTAHTDAVALLTARRDHLQRLLDEQFAAARAALDGIREQKRSALHATLRHALTAAGEVATVTAAGSAVMASALDHAARINVARSIAVTLPHVAAPMVWYVDTTVGISQDPREPVLPLGVVVSGAVDVTRSVLDVGSGASIWVGQRIDGTVRLVGHDRVLTDAPDGGLVVDAVVVEEEGPGGVAGGPAPVPVPALRLSSGVYRVTVPVPGARDRSRLVISARVGGRHVAGSPASLHYVPPARFDPLAIQGATVVDGVHDSTFTTVGDTWCTGRSCVMRTGPGVTLDLCVEVALAPPHNYLTLALGAGEALSATPFDYASNTHMAFFFNGMHGAVNQPWGTWGPHPKAKDAWRGVVYLHIRGCTLTFSAGEVGSPVVSQPGTWTLPSDFYLHVACYMAGHTIKVSVH